MTEKNSQAQQDTPPQEGRQIAVNAQYVKDLSFENPKAPQSLVAPKEKPTIDIDINVNARNVQENLYEVALNITAKGRVEQDPLFITELSYAGLFTLKNIQENEMEMALLVYCPNLLFPFARRIIADTTRDGGLPPLMLEPIDFARLHLLKQQQNTEATEKKAASN